MTFGKLDDLLLLHLPFLLSYMYIYVYACACGMMCMQIPIALPEFLK